eukprot:6213169-Prymnesium_polylepis.1
MCIRDSANRCLEDARVEGDKLALAARLSHEVEPLNLIGARDEVRLELPHHLRTAPTGHRGGAGWSDGVG